MIKGEEAKIKIKAGIDLVADYVKITLGPKGRNVALKQLGPLPTRVINDGVTIAKEVKSEDPFIQAGVEMVQEICAKTNDNAGDGTTQTAILAQAIINEGQKRLVSGLNPIDLKNEIEADCDQLIEVLGTLSKPVENVETIRSLATISGNNDETIGNALAEVMENVGLNASIIIERGHEEKIKVETIKGMYFDKGYRLPGFINFFEKGTTELKNPAIILVDSSIKWDDEVIELLKACHALDESKDEGEERQFKNVVLIANEIEGEALQTLVMTNVSKYDKNNQSPIYFNILAIEAPYFGGNRADFMEDLAVYTGGQVVKKLTDIDYKSAFGSCEKIISNSKTTTIIAGAGSDEAKTKKIDEIKSQVAQLDSSEKTTKEFLEKRRDVMESGVGVIYAGGKTEIEMRDRYLRLEDAVRASKSAVQDGYVAGGGLTYLKLSKFAKSDIMAKALKSVMAQVALNAGKGDYTVVASVLAAHTDDKIITDYHYGYNAKTDVFEDLIEAGVIDATLVLKNALQNATSLAAMFLTTDAVITEEEVEKKLDFNKGF